MVASKQTRAMVLVACGALVMAGSLAGCTPARVAKPQPAPAEVSNVSKAVRVASLISQGDVEAAAGRKAEATAIFQAAANENPSSKIPWIKLAQLQLRDGDNLTAIQHANEALARDAADPQALSIRALASLRIANAALAQVKKHGLVTEDLRIEGNTLSLHLRDLIEQRVDTARPSAVSISEPVVMEPVVEPVPAQVEKAKPDSVEEAKRKVVAVPPKPSSTKAVPSNPFENLR